MRQDPRSPGQVLVLDGSIGEGGGQILRSALALSMLTSKPFRLENIRAGRRKPGLMRQHLTAVKAAQQVSNAKVHGDELGSASLDFTPASVQPGIYEYSVGTAGSTMLVLQAILPALMVASGPSTVVLSGGTHNPMAPTFEFVCRCFAPILRKMGVGFDLHLERCGFYPAGGGRIRAEIQPCKSLDQVEALSWSEPTEFNVEAIISRIPVDIATRELEQARRLLGWDERVFLCREVDSPGPGNVLHISVESKHGTEIATGFGERRRSVTEVVASAVDSMKRYLDAKAPVGEYLADQLILPFAMAGGGAFKTQALSSHTRTNIEVVRAFLDVEIDVHEDRGNATVRFKDATKRSKGDSS